MPPPTHSSPQILNTFHAKQIKLIATGGGSDSNRKAGGFSMVVTNSGLLYAFGANTRGQLGIGDTEDRIAIVPVNLMTKSPVSKVGTRMIPGRTHRGHRGCNAVCCCGTKTSNGGQAGSVGGHQGWMDGGIVLFR